jgi:RNA polymerase sigma-70 factor (ECF subfamily)
VDIDDALEGPLAEQASASRIDDPAEVNIQDTFDDEIDAALRALPEEYLTVVMLVDLQDFTYEEAAEVLACPIGTVRSRLFRGRKLLHRKLFEYARSRGLVEVKAT